MIASQNFSENIHNLYYSQENYTTELANCRAENEATEGKIEEENINKYWKFLRDARKRAPCTYWKSDHSTGDESEINKHEKRLALRVKL